MGAGVAVLVMMAAFLAEHWLAPARVTREASIGALLRRDGTLVGVVDIPSGAARGTLELSDGSHVVLEPGTHLEALASSAREFIVRLSAGTALFDVEPFGPRRWVIEAGLANVEVVGTRFTVARRVDSVRVDVERGSVLVRGATVPDGIVRLDAGGFIEVKAAPTAAPSATGSKALAAPAPRQPTTRAEPGDEAWRREAARGDYELAYGDLGADGVRREAARAETGEDLFALADVARLSGHPAEAVMPLERLEREFGSSPRAPLATLTLGRIELELGNPARASKAFERALALHVPAALEEDVYARLAESYARAGDKAAALAVRDAYAKKFPEGRRRADIDHWLAR
jgi:transmembrane sensor